MLAHTPIRKDYTVLIKSTVDCIRTLEFRMNRAQSDFQKALKCPGTDPDLINRHATRLRLITLLGRGMRKRADAKNAAMVWILI